MPEGHTIHRLAARHRDLFAGHRVRAASPQGRFTEGAAQSPGSQMIGSPPILVEACDVVAIAEGWDGFAAAPRS